MENKNYFMGSYYFIHQISGKWKPSIITALETGDYRYSELLKHLRSIHHTQISPKVLTEQLQQLEDAGIIVRKNYGTVPPKVKFFLTPIGVEISKELFYLNRLGERLSKFSNKKIDFTISASKADELKDKYQHYQ